MSKGQKSVGRSKGCRPFNTYNGWSMSYENSTSRVSFPRIASIEQRIREADRRSGASVTRKIRCLGLYTVYSEERLTRRSRRLNDGRIFRTPLVDPAACQGSAPSVHRVQTPGSGSSGYAGSTAAISLTYTLLGSTRFSGTITRDVEFSYDIDQPYYV